MVVGGEGGLEAEAAAMEVDEDGKFVVVVWREEQAGGDGRVEGD